MTSSEKAYCGGGAVILGVEGATIKGKGQLSFQKSDGTQMGSIDMVAESGRDVMRLLTVGAEKDIALESGGYQSN